MRKRVTDGEFVELANSSDSVEEVAEKSGYKKGTVYEKIRKLAAEGHFIDTAIFNRRPADVFVRIWNDSHTRAEFLARNGQSADSAKAQGSTLRGKGANLKTHARYTGQEWQWVAGYFDARGSAVIRKSAASLLPRLSVSGSEDVLKKIQSLIGGGNIARNNNSLRLEWTSVGEIRRVAGIILPSLRSEFAEKLTRTVQEIEENWGKARPGGL